MLDRCRRARQQPRQPLVRRGAFELARQPLDRSCGRRSSFTRDLDQAIVERRGAARSVQRLRGDGVGVPAIGGQLLPQIEGATTTPVRALSPTRRRSP